MKKHKKIAKTLLFILFGLILLFALTVAAGRIINTQRYKIRSLTGVQESGYITLGGIEQYVQIRGQDVSNPVIIMLHGGPGSNMAYYSYYWQTALEGSYTIVHYDQRGCGNTYYRNKEKADKPNLELLLSDLDELVDYIRAGYDKEKVIIMGHSWGTFLGGIYSGRHPEKVSAYVGVSQMAGFIEAERTSAEEAIRLAREAGKDGDARKIEELLETAISFQTINTPEFAEYMKLRQLAGKYLPSGDNMSAVEMVSIGLFSPYMTFNDLKWYLVPMFDLDKFVESNSELYDTLFLGAGFSMFDYTTRYEVPVMIFAGDCDWITPFDMARDYYNGISAPQKEFIRIENAGHNLFLDKPEDFTGALLEALGNLLSTGK